MTLEDLKQIFPKMTKEQEAAVIELLNKKKRTIHPPKEVNGELHYYCKYFDEYFPVNKMVVSNGKSKGYSKLGNSIWLKLNADYNRLMTILFEKKLTEKEQETIKEYMTWLKETKNKSEIYKSGYYKKLLDIDDTIKLVQRDKKEPKELVKQITSVLKEVKTKEVKTKEAK